MYGRKPVLVLLAFGFFFLFLPTQLPNSYAQEAAVVAAKTTKFSWPLDFISHYERTFRLRSILGIKNFNVIDEDATDSEKQCGELLSELREKEPEFLEPTIRGSRIEGELNQLLTSCPKIPIDRAWFSLERGPLVPGANEVFDRLTVDDKDSAADFYYEYAKNVELYDLSAAFDGKRVWGTFAEEGSVVCNERGRQICDELEGFRLNSGLVLSAVFDEDTCTILLGPRTGLQGRLRTNATYPYSYVEYPNFHGFIKLNSGVYRVSVESAYPWSKMKNIFTEDGSITMKFERINSEITQTCKFRSTTQRTR